MTRIDPNARKGFPIIYRVLLSFIFAISFRQAPLYSSNQNAHLLQGLANAGLGYLRLDWLAQTLDPFPIFSALVCMTVQIIGENAFYFLYVVILAVYGYSILGIVDYGFGIDNGSTKYFTFLALLTLWYSGRFYYILSQLPGLEQYASILNPNGVLVWGAAGFYILGPIFQPSVFGVFLVLSIYFFLHNKLLMAAACLVITVMFHPVYMLSAAILTCAYMGIIFVDHRDYRKALLFGISVLGLVMPLLIYNYTVLGPTTPNTYWQAQSIFMDYRGPHHTKISVWFDASEVLQFLVIVVSIYLARRTRLFPILLVLCISTVTLTVAQVLTGSRGLTLLLPWRISALLVPIGSSIILAAVVYRASQIFDNLSSKLGKLIQFLSIAAMIISGYLGARYTLVLLNAPRVGDTPLTQFVSNTFQPEYLYLIPPNMESFRLAARVPILVDFKSTPYKDTELLEWFHRITIANNFYASDGDTACKILRQISYEYGVTHILLESEKNVAQCEMLNEIYRDEDFAVYRIWYP